MRAALKIAPLALVLSELIMSPSMARDYQNDPGPAELCSVVGEKIRDTQSAASPLPFWYRTILYRWVGVDTQKDVPEDLARKIQVYWLAHRQEFYSSDLNAMIGSATLLKLAVDRSSNEFIDDAVRRWKLDLNEVDRMNGGTVLDFIDAELEKARGTPRESILARYQKLFSSHGAKHAGELR